MSTEEFPLKEQFVHPAEQVDTDILGMWVFLATEILFFGAVFCTFGVYASFYEEAFAIGSAHLGKFWGTLNTIILLTSSLLVALSDFYIKKGQVKKTSWALLGVCLLGFAFLGIKAYEYIHHYHEGLVPKINFTYLGPEAQKVELFFVFYFVTTMIHALHMIIGIGVMLVLFIFSRKGKFGQNYNAPIEVSGLYWHFVDIVWIFLWPLLYLFGGGP